VAGYRDLVLIWSYANVANVANFLYFARLRNLQMVSWITMPFFPLVGLQVIKVLIEIQSRGRRHRVRMGNLFVGNMIF